MTIANVRNYFRGNAEDEMKFNLRVLVVYVLGLAGIAIVSWVLQDGSLFIVGSLIWLVLCALLQFILRVK